ncbi:HEPN domain-containing protein [Methanospirillum purgamenti]|jgi:Uncharacterized conserved protein related to C-terminal domain of eukaryotic chaperone, SACSIN|uniref:HEPN domain-containing protein n=1 Tax=Methanospirillum hungatei TaxID=2203 RepID=A0A8F5ZDN6_METHU|nr:HEPN domain-containing protein [Methanospirillum hungatei]QXO93505.1 HEPN domain-containing protein [Methanospirillum hungatei]
MPERSHDWIVQAKYDLKAAVDNCMAGNYEWACFISQQAAEKSIKSLYQYFGGDAWGHSAEKLLIGLIDSIDIDGGLLSHAKRLDRLYIISRYPDGLTYGTPHEHFTREDAHAAISSAGNIIRFCQDILA